MSSSLASPPVLDMSPDTLSRALRLLRAGGLVLLPTETYYGAAAAALDRAAVARLVALKGRPPGQPLPLIVPDEARARALLSHWPEAAARLATRYWPGPLTLVLPARPGLPDPLVGPRGVALRVSSHPVASALARASGAPITATSANRSGADPPRTAADAARALPGADLVINGGTTPGGPPSTVVAVDANGDPVVLRQGAVDVG